MEEETIRQTAYRLWEQQGKPDGQDFVHWLQARDELERPKTDSLPGSISSSVSAPKPKPKPKRSKRASADNSRSGA
ncbi:DUF2934 domain-containing protein [Pseudomonas yamanorum]|uniref:DUF2934 domain-containing protein n=1 Tax=Pseudomonas yamanorum TaxID=515393 RepID=UPI003D361D66